MMHPTQLMFMLAVALQSAPETDRPPGANSTGIGFTALTPIWDPGPIDDETTGGPCTGNGVCVAVTSIATDILAPGADTNGLQDIYLFDRTGPFPIRISTAWGGFEADGASYSPAISANGSWVTFSSDATNLLANQDVLLFRDVFLYETAANTMQRASESFNHDKAGEANGHSFTPAISANGNFVVFASDATNLISGDTNGFRDIFLWHRTTRIITRVSRGVGGAQPAGHSRNPAVSRDGQLVVFASDAPNLVPNDNNSQSDIFLYNGGTGATKRISVAFGGGDSNGDSLRPAMDSTGRYVCFESDATDLVAVDGNNRRDVFLRDRSQGSTVRVSVPTGGGETDGPSGVPSVSRTGRVAFWSDATNLVPLDTNGVRDVFLYDAVAGLVRASLSSTGSESNGPSFAPTISDMGRDVVFASDATNLVPTDPNGARDLFWHRSSSLELTLDMTPTLSALGAPLTITVGGGSPGAVVLVYSAFVNGLPLSLKLLNGVFDGSGVFQTSPNIPNDPTLSGLVVTLVAFGGLPSGKIGITDLRWTFIQ